MVLLAERRAERASPSAGRLGGIGVAGSHDYQSDLREGHFVFVPKGVPHWLRNEDNATALEIFNVLTGAGSLEEAGYVGVD